MRPAFSVSGQVAPRREPSSNDLTLALVREAGVTAKEVQIKEVLDWVAKVSAQFDDLSEGRRMFLESMLLHAWMKGTTDGMNDLIEEARASTLGIPQ